MNKLFTKVAALSVGLAMAIGVGVGFGSKAPVRARAANATLTLSSLGSGFTNTSTSNHSGTFTVSGYSFSYYGKKQGTAAFVPKSSDNGYFYNTTAIPGNIVSVTIKTSSNAAGGAGYAVAFSASAITAKYTTGGTSQTLDANATSSAYTNSVTGAKYFCVYMSNSKNGQVLNLTVVYESSFNPTHAGTEADPYSVADARGAIDAGVGTSSVYATGVVTSIVTAYNPSYGNISFDFKDEGGTDTLRAYRCTGTDAADVTVGDTVVVSGNLTKYGSVYEFAEGCVLESLTHPTVTTTYDVTFDSNGGSENPTAKEVGEGLTFIFPSPGTKANYLFSGWSNDSGTTFHQADETSAEVYADADYVAYWQTKGLESDPYTVAQAKTAIDANKGLADACVSGIISNVDSYNGTYHSITYTISDDGETTGQQLECYSGKGLNGADFSAKTDIVVGASVVVTGLLKLYNSKYEFDKNNFMLSYTEPTPVPSISVTPTSLTLRIGGDPQTITATTTNAGEVTPVWDSSNNSVATVTNAGVVSPVGEGTCTITATITVDEEEYSAECSVTVKPAAPVIDVTGNYTLVTNVSNLSAGDDVIITNSDGSFALSTEQKTNNRGATSTDIHDGTISIFNSTTSIQVFALEEYEIESETVFAFYAGSDSYIYAASSSSNHLKTYTSLDANGKFDISIDSSTGVATVEAQGDHTHNLLQYNKTDKLFSCYGNAQTDGDVCIYKKTSAIDPTVVAYVKLNKASDSIFVNRSTSLSATIVPDTATTQTVSWLSSSTAVATVSANGVVTGESTGSATITAYADENGNGQLDSGEKSATCAITVVAASSEEWVETELAELTSDDTFVIVGNNGSNYAMSNDNGTSSAPSAVSVTVTSGKITSVVGEEIKWNLSVSSGSYTFYPDGTDETWLYCTNTNNGVRVGTNANKAFTIDGGYLKHSATSRYVGVYNSSDWRCYTSKTGTSNIAGQTFKFYKYVEGASYTAGDFADELLESLSTGSAAICVADGSTQLNGLKAAWASLAINFGHLGVEDKATLAEGQASESGTKIQKALALYDYIATKYGHSLESSDLNNFDFIGRNITPRSNVRIAIFGQNGVDTDTTLIIVIASIVAVAAVGGYFFLRRKKEQ